MTLQSFLIVLISAGVSFPFIIVFSVMAAVKSENLTEFLFILIVGVIANSGWLYFLSSVSDASLEPYSDWVFLTAVAVAVSTVCGLPFRWIRRTAKTDAS